MRVDRMALTRYNGYDCTKDRLHLFSPDDLEELRRIDKYFDRLYAPLESRIDEYERALQAAAKRNAVSRQLKYYHANKDRIALKRKAYYERNREARQEYLRQYRARKKSERGKQNAAANTVTSSAS